jgi:aminoglycoside 3-N-acetyltransferase
LTALHLSARLRHHDANVHSRERLTVDLRTLGLAPGDTVMVHASVRAVGEVAGGPDEIHLAIKDAITGAGTMFMYIGCPRYVDEVGRGNLTAAQEAEVLEKLPCFDASTARSARDHGTLAEFFRTYPGSRVNDHPARFAAWGHGVGYLFLTQPWNYAYGHDSALARFVARDGKILLLGSDPDHTTFLHHVEHVADIPDKRVVQFKVPVVENGLRVWREMVEYDTSQGVHAHWPNDIFSRLIRGFLLETANEGGQVGDAQSYLMSSVGLQRYAQPIMERVARDARAAASLRL